MAVFISGCSTGIGFSTATFLKERGYEVFATARKESDLDRLSQEGLHAIRLDVCDSDSIKKAVDKAIATSQDGIDVLINNAAYGQAGALEDISVETLKKQFDANVFGLHALTNAFLPHMREKNKGRIINISSILGLVSIPFMGAYTASKYAIEGLSDTLRLELYDTPIKVILIEPGPIESKFRDTSLKTALESIDYKQSAYKARYEKLMADREAEKKNRFMKPPQAVIDKIVHAIEAKNPKPRYKVTVPSHLLSFLKRILPTRQLDWILHQA